MNTLRGHDSACFGLAWTSDMQRLASTSDDKTLKIWDWKTEKCLVTCQGLHVYLNPHTAYQEVRTLSLLPLKVPSWWSLQFSMPTYLHMFVHILHVLSVFR